MLSLEGREIADEESDPHDQIRERDVLARLGEAVKNLPPMQRDVFLLRAQQGLPYEEIAVALETSVGAARVYYHHAVKRVKHVLECD